MKRSSLFVLGLFVATCAVGCGSSNPMGPSFARTAPATETQVSAVPIEGQEPGSSDDGSFTTPEADPVHQGGTRKDKNANWKRGHETAPGQQEEPSPEEPFERP
jgi:hypothetical protein